MVRSSFAAVVLASVVAACSLDRVGEEAVPPEVVFCIPGTSEVCPYAGPGSTLSVGVCRAPARTCAPDGRAFGPCEGEVVPALDDDCSTSRDENCDGQTNEGCVCEPKAVTGCYEGDPETENVGVCHGGQRRCSDDGRSLGPCEGQVVPGPEDCVTLLDDDCDRALPTCQGTTDWGTPYGTAATDVAYGIAVDGAGNAYVAGISDAVFDAVLGPIQGDVFVAKYAPDGAPVWIRSFAESPGPQAGLRLALTAGGRVVVVGWFSGTVDFGGGPITAAAGRDAFVLELDSSGAFAWLTTFAGELDQQATAVATRGEHVHVGGSFSGSIDFGGGAQPSSGGEDAFIAELDEHGVYLDSLRFGGAGADGITALAAHPDGSVFIAGGFGAEMSIAGEPLSHAGGQDVLFARLSAGNEVLFAKAYGDAADQRAEDLALDPKGNVVVVGSFTGALAFEPPGFAADGVDAFVVKLDGLGQTLWQKSFRGTSEQHAIGVATDPFGNVLAAGYHYGQIDFGAGAVGASSWDAWVAKLAPDGSPVWTRTFGPDWDQFGMRVGADASGGVRVAGYYYVKIDLGLGELGSSAHDVFVAELAP